MNNEIETVDNMQKYENYKEQFKRLNMALSHRFYLEAIFISYAIMEDRTESILRHSGKWEAYLKKRRGHQVTIDSKIKYIEGFATQKKTLLNKYFGDDLLDGVLEWKEKRNQIIHALMKQFLTTEELEELASSGKMLSRKLADRAGSYRRAIEREEKKKMIIS